MSDRESWSSKNAFLLVVFAALISGISGILVKYMSIPPTSMAAIRSTIPVLFAGTLIALNRENPFRSGYKSLLGASVINVARIYLFFAAYIYTTVGNAVIVLYTWPVFATILSVLFLKEKVSRNHVLLLILAFIGIIVVYSDKTFSFQNDDFLGISAALACAFFYACTIIIFKSKNKDFSPTETIFFQNIMAVVVFVPIFLWTRPFPAALDWTLASTHGLLIGVIMFFSFFYGLKHIAASKASMITYLEIISALLLGYLFLGETLTTTMWIGGGIIIFSTAMIRLSK